MATIPYRNEDYTFDDRKLTTADWLAIPQEMNVRESQAQILCELSIDPKLTMDSIKTKGFDFIPKMLNELNCLGE